MQTFILILILIAITIILVFIHELGHFLAAKYSGVYVGEFAVGFGPKLFQFKYKETYYSLRILPFGGYVSLLTDEIVSKIEEAKQQLDSNPEIYEQLVKQIKPYDLEQDFSSMKTYEKSSYFQKSLIVLAGVTLNLILSFIVLLGTYGIQGKVYNTNMIYTDTNLTMSPFLANVQDSTVVYNITNQNPNFKYCNTEITLGCLTDELLGKDDYDLVYNQMTTSFYQNFNFLIIKDKDSTKIDQSSHSISEIINPEKKDISNGITLEDSLNSYDKVFEMADSKNNIYYGYDQTRDIINDIFDGSTLKIYYKPRLALEVLPKKGGETSLLSYSPEVGNQPITLQTSDSIYRTLMYTIDNNGVNYGSNEIDYADTIKYEGLVYNPYSQMNELWYSVEIKLPDYINSSESIEVNGYDIYSMNMFIDNVFRLNFTNELSGGDAFINALTDTFKYMATPYAAIFSQPDLSIHVQGKNETQSGYQYMNFNIALAALSSMLILFNMLPIPPLDGYKFYEATYEKLRKKEISQETKIKMNKYGWSFIMIITVVLIVVPFFVYF